MTQNYPVYGRIDGPIVIIGFGSIGKGTWPLIERHFDYDASKLTVIEPDPRQANFLRQHGLKHLQVAITQENYREVLGELFADGQGFCVNLSVLLARHHEIHARAWRALCRHGGRALGRLLLRHQRQRGAHELRAARDEKAARRNDGGELLRRREW